jgi:NAD(P)H-nitrite reductase large subunit
MSSLKYFGIPIVSIGMANPKEDLIRNHNQTGQCSVCLQEAGPQKGIIVGMTFLGDIDRAGILFYLMKNKVNVQKFKAQLLADDFGLAALPVDLRKKMNLEE